MEQESRKATDVLLNVESKIGVILDLVRAQDLVIKILSNKLNDVINRLDKQLTNQPPKIVVETVQTMPKSSVFSQLPVGDSERTIPVTAEGSLPQTDTPQGFRRNSRPETYVPKNSSPITTSKVQQLGDEIKMPLQIPNMLGLQVPAMPPPGRNPGSEVVAAPQASGMNKRGAGAVIAPPQPQGSSPMVMESIQGQIPVSQRCVDKNGKSIWLADVEIVDMATAQPIFKGRTTGTGKWMTALGIGVYRVTISKCESVTKEKLEAIQDIQIDGSVSKLELPMLIIK